MTFGSRRELDKCIAGLNSVPHSIFAIMLEKLGGKVSIDHEDVAPLFGKAVAYKCENGTIHMWLADVVKEKKS